MLSREERLSFDPKEPYVSLSSALSNQEVPMYPQSLHVSAPLVLIPPSKTEAGVIIGAHYVVGKGSTYNVGRNKFKRGCKTRGLNRVQAERLFGHDSEAYRAIGEPA